MLSFSLLVASISVVAAQQLTHFECPLDVNGDFPHEVMCDRYYECKNGVKEERICPDGLIFDESRRGSQCNYPFQTTTNCDYLDENKLQAPHDSGIQCPRQNGFFEHEDLSDCRSYYLCSNGDHKLMKCNSGLVFDEFSGSCVWEHLSQRTGCVEHKTQVDGFVCPENATQSAANGHNLIHARYADPADCRYFYVCQNNKEPVRIGCPDSLVFNDINIQCDDPKNVKECENYYGEEITSNLQIQ